MTDTKRNLNDGRDLSEVLAAFRQIAQSAGKAEGRAVTAPAEAERRRKDRALLLQSAARPLGH